MPLWLQWIIWAGAGIVACAAIWTKFLKPIFKLIAYMHELLPLISELLKRYRENPNYIDVLTEIADQFKTDSGSTLRDVVNRLEVAANKAESSAKELRIKASVLEEKVAVGKELATSDRVDAAHKLVLLDGLIVRVDELVARIKVDEGPQVTTTPSTPLAPGTNVIAVVEATKVDP